MVIHDLADSGNHLGKLRMFAGGILEVWPGLGNHDYFNNLSPGKKSEVSHGNS